MALSREQILGAADLPIVEVDTPEWGGAVCIRTMTGAERDAFETRFLAARTENIRARLVAQVACDEEGHRLFSDHDVVELGSKSAAALDRLFAAAVKLNGMSKADVDELEKNSEASQSDDGLSSSRCL